MKLPTIGIQTTFIARENIAFMAEWIAHFYNLGVTKFYLYDNSKVELSGDRCICKLIGDDSGLPKGVNRHGLNFTKCILGSDDDIAGWMDDIKNLFPKGVVNYIEWSPINDDGVIVMEQTVALNEAWKIYGDEVDWLIHMDMDEFIIGSKTIQELISTIPENCDMVEFDSQFHYASRFNDTTKMVLEFDTCFEYLGKRIAGEIGRYKYMFRTASQNISWLDVHLVRGNDMLMKESGINLGIHFNHYKKYDTEYSKELVTQQTKCMLNDLQCKVNPIFLNNVRQKLHDNTGSVEWKEEIVKYSKSKHLQRLY